MSDCLTVAEVLAMHTDQIERYGGAHGVRDPGLPEATLYRRRPVITPTSLRKPSRSGRAVSQKHPFINRARLTADSDETAAFVATVYEANQFSFDKLVPWLRSHVTM